MVMNSSFSVTYQLVHVLMLTCSYTEKQDPVYFKKLFFSDNLHVGQRPKLSQTKFPVTVHIATLAYMYIRMMPRLEAIVLFVHSISSLCVLSQFKYE